MSFTKKLTALIAVCLCCGAALQAQEKFSYEDLHKGMFSQKGVSGIRSMSDGEHYTITKDKKIEKYAYSDGKFREVIFDAKEHEAIKSFSGYEFSTSENKILLTTNRKGIYRRSYSADHYLWDRVSGSLRPITSGGREQVPVVSPDETKIAFVRDNNLWLTEIGGQTATQITTDGEKNSIINGHTDWVYEEEFGFTRAFEFSPDGKKIAFLRFDESAVSEYSMTVFGRELYPRQQLFKYPKAGERNSTVTLWVYDIESAVTTKVERGAEDDIYIPLIGWTPGGELYFILSDRLQNHYRLMLADKSGQTRSIYEERSERYIEHISRETITFLPDSRNFIVKNESSGWMHLYLYHTEKGLVNAITQGQWEVKDIVLIGGNRLYYTGNEGSPLRNNLYSVGLNGRNKRRITTGRGSYSIAPSKGMKYFIGTFSNVATPQVVTLHKGDGKIVRVLEDNAALARRVDSMEIPVKEFFEFTTERGDRLNGYLLKPGNFDPNGHYPIFMTQYSGPGSQSVSDRWGMDWQHVLVQRGYVVACVDGRGTGGRGEQFRKCTYGDLGAKEVEDQISAAKWLATQTWADGDRVGIYGWSYGGFMALNCILKGSELFKMAIAVAPVTSWRFYDTIYTEIYNGLPQSNPRGYDDNSPINYAHLLSGKLLIMHGTGDDNVHAQNSYRMVDALVRAGKKFDMMIYTDSDHSMAPAGSRHITEKMIDYTLENL